MKNKILIHICLLAMILVTSSCTLQQTAKDPLTILEMKTCEPPCWQGITPGITTKEEARTLIHNINFFPERPDLLIPEFTDIYWVNTGSFNFREPNIWVEIRTDEQDIVDYIVFNFANNNRPKLEDCTDLLGEPQFIGLSIGRGDAYFRIISPYTELLYSRSMSFRPATVRMPYSSSTRIGTIVYRSDQVKPNDFDYYFPWNEKAILQFEKNY